MALGHVGEPLDPRVEIGDARRPAPGRDGAPAAPAPRRAAPRRAPASPSAAIASATTARCRSLPTRLRITPAMRTAGSCAAKPRTTAAADCDCPDTSSTSSTGRPKCAARSAVAPRRPAAPGAVEQAHDAFDDENVRAGCGLRGQRVEQRARHRPAVEIDARRAGRRGMERRIDIVRPGLGGAHARCRAARSAASSASVTVVLPAPERGAAMMRPRAVTANPFQLRQFRRATARASRRCRRSRRSPAARIFARARPRRVFPASRPGRAASAWSPRR